MQHSSHRYFITAIFIGLQFFVQAQMPILTVAQKETKDVRMQSIKIDVQVTGNIATTVMEMVFKNSTDRILEGELVFPLPENVSVSRYAIDINGKMREAVSVDKIKGTQVFETIEKRRVDPGLLEKVAGNNFRTRIYPIPANGSRTVLIGYEQELQMDNKHQLRYYLPMDFKEPIENFSLKTTVWQSSTKPLLEEKPDGDFAFAGGNSNYVAETHRQNFKPSKALAIALPKAGDVPEVLMQPAGNSYYFMVNTFPKAQSRPKVWGNRLGIIWDVSLSSLQRNVAKELVVLDAIIKQKKNLTVSLGLLNHQFVKAGDFTITNGDWATLRKKLEQQIFDGGTNYSAIQLTQMPADEYLFFTDGLSTFGPADFVATKPIYCISSQAKADYSQLKWMSAKTGGRFVNLQQFSTTDAAKLLNTEPLQYLGMRYNFDVSETYPAIPTAVVGQCSVSGILAAPKANIILQYGYGNTVTEEKTIQLDGEHKSSTGLDLSRIWAQKKIAEMDIRYEQNQEAISQLGKQFGIVTRNTSLIVLETVQDYIRYAIVPPAELLKEYYAEMKQRNAEVDQTNNRFLGDAISSMSQLQTWWNTDFKPIKMYPVPDNKPLLILEHSDNGAVAQANMQRIPPPPPQVQTSRFTPPRVVANREAAANKSADLQEVVVVGYGTQRRTSVSSTQTVQADNLEARQISVNALQGRVAGLQLSDGYSGSSPQVRIRGAASLPGGDVLYVVDGQAVKKEDVPEANKIASMNVLKDESATAIYGSRAANGVVIINTKNNINNATITTATIKSDKDYMLRMVGIDTKKAYQQYLQERKIYLSTPVFYFDMANWFYANHDSGTALKILSNIAELQLENAELTKLMAYKLKEAGQFGPEIFATHKVLEWRPMEPQSYRDYGLALADAGHYQQALDNLYFALTKAYEPRIADAYNGIEEIIATEINQLITLHRRDLDISKIDTSLLHKLPVDVRVVINWNMNDTDIDLWVTDPNGEKCFYSHKETAVGGRISKDFTQGYGPEQFMLKKAMKGKYKVEVNYYGDRQVKLAGATAVMAEIFTHYADGTQHRKVITLQMPGKEKEGVFIGEFAF